MASQGLSVSVEQDRATIRLDGEHEAYSAEKLAKSIAGLVAEGVPVTIDLRRADFIDSTVVGVLIAGERRATEAGLDFRLLLGDETGWPVRRILEVTGRISPGRDAVSQAQDSLDQGDDSCQQFSV